MKKDIWEVAISAFVSMFIFATVLAAVQVYGISKQKAVECGFAYNGGGCHG